MRDSHLTDLLWSFQPLDVHTSQLREPDVGRNHAQFDINNFTFCCVAVRYLTVRVEMVNSIGQTAAT